MSITQDALKNLFTSKELTMIGDALMKYSIPEHEWEDDEDEAAEAQADYEELEDMRLRLIELFE